MATTEDYTSYGYDKLSTSNAILRADFARVDNEMQNMSTAIADLAIRLEALEDYVAGLYERVATAQTTASLARIGAALAHNAVGNAGLLASEFYKDSTEKGATE